MASIIDENLRKKINVIIFSTVASAKSISLQSLEKELIAMEGKSYTPDEYRRAGFKNLTDVLKSHKDIRSLPNGEYMADSDDRDMNEITNMVQHQKNNKGKKKPKTRRASSAAPFFPSVMNMRPQTGLIPSKRPIYPGFNPPGRYFNFRTKPNAPIAISPSLTPDRIVSATKPGNLLITVNNNSSKKTRKPSTSATADVEPPKYQVVIPPNCGGQSSSKTPGIQEFKDNVIAMFRMRKGLEVHMDQLSAEYGKEYGVYFDPYDIYAKKWPTLLKSFFADHLVMDENKIVRLIGSRPPTIMPKLVSNSSISMKGRGDFYRPAHLVEPSLNESFSEKEKSTASFGRSQTSMGFGSNQLVNTTKPVDVPRRAVDRQVGLDPRIARLAFKDLKIQEMRNPVERKIMAVKTPETVPSPPSLSHSPAEIVFKAPELPKPKPKKIINLPPAVKPIFHDEISKREKIVPRRLTSNCQMNQVSEPTNRFERMAREAEFKFDDDSASF